MTPLHLRVQELREAKGLSQSQLATTAKIRRATLIAIEQGKTSGVDFAVLERLAVALGVDPGFLVVRTLKGGKR